MRFCVCLELLPASSAPTRSTAPNGVRISRMTNQIPLSDLDAAPRRDCGDGAWSVSDDLCYLRLMMVNVVIWGRPRSSDWVLIDTGLRTSVDEIIKCTERRFGSVPPAAIVLTHGHF